MLINGLEKLIYILDSKYSVDFSFLIHLKKKSIQIKLDRCQTFRKLNNEHKAVAWC